jgi:hypothetical protein
MRFEGRDLKPYSEPISSSALVEGEVYFSVGFVDDMLVPMMETLVFIGRNLDAGDDAHLYFQDIESHRRGIRYPGGDDHKGVARFIRTAERHGGQVFDFEHALNELLSCSLRRGERSGK